MTDFQIFAKAVHQNFLRMSAHELFVLGDDNRTLELVYLSAFPEGTNPIYKTNTEHDCSCCKNFIRNLGNLAALEDGQPLSVWHGLQDMPYPYNEVAATMVDFLVSQPISNVFRTKERQYGAEETKSLLEDQSVKRWNHFHGRVADRHFTAMPDTESGKYRTNFSTLLRAMMELKLSAVDDVIGLIEANALYRGTEHLPALQAFRKVLVKFQQTPGEDQNFFLWANANSGAAHFRNTVIGTLVTDISEGKDLEYAVKGFESKVAPTNYKRPTALITPKMVEQAMTTLGALGLEPALKRRLAKISDVKVNNVLWVDGRVKPMMAGGIADVLMAAAAKPTIKGDKATDIGIEDFMKSILPTATGIDMLVQGQHLGNLMTLTAPVEADSGRLFKWDNDFAWSYAGNIADSEIRRAVSARGGRVDGVFRFSHSWNYDKRNASLMDLHVFMPGSTQPEDGIHDSYGNTTRVGWNNRNHASSGGVQDVDYVNPAPVGYVPVENITFPSLDKLKDGKYVCKIHNWRLRTPTEAGFRAEIEFGGQLFQYEVTRPLKHHEWVTVAVVTLKAGKFTIEHKLPVGAASQEKWGITTETAVKVDTVMFSPNYWDDNAVGNKHWFFILSGCRTDESTRGIYNEFLSNELEQHRKVFEVLGDKTKCPPADEQLSGMGFSSTKGDSVTLQVRTDKRLQTFNVKF